MLPVGSYRLSSLQGVHDYRHVCRDGLPIFGVVTRTYKIQITYGPVESCWMKYEDMLCKTMSVGAVSSIALPEAF
jgi:hypothetical protein